MKRNKLSDLEIEKLYSSSEFKLTLERSDFLLPQIIDFIDRGSWLNLRPEYQRRLVWDNKKKSRFIESILMNIPIPPVFLYEHEYGRYEVMDGQQRLNTIVEFYENRLKLTGLTEWSALNGYSYADCPQVIQRGLDRRRISATVILAESAKEEDQKSKIRRSVFERLNTGGQTLKPQELRNCLYDGWFNRLLIELASDRQFNEMWDIPPYADNIRKGKISAQLASNNYFQRMRDVEIVLRFFAFRRKGELRSALKTILDRCMQHYMKQEKEQSVILMSNFYFALSICRGIFGDEAFRLPDGKLSAPLFDAQMVAIDRIGTPAEHLPLQSESIRADLHEALKSPDNYDLVTNRSNTALALKRRIELLESIYQKHL